MERPADVPQAAIVASEGNQRLVYTADGNGTVWVCDQPANKIIYSGQVEGGDRLVLDPSRCKLTLNDRVVCDQRITWDNHKVFFLAGYEGRPPLTASDQPVSRPPLVPTAAALKAEGRQHVQYTAQDDGMVWVSDVDTGKVVYCGRVLQGDRIVVDPVNSTLSLDNQPLMTHDLSHDNHRIFFLSEDRARTAGFAMPPADVETMHQLDGVVPRPDGVPQVANLRCDGSIRVELRAESDGTAWIVDATTNRLIYSGRLIQGDLLAVDPPGSGLTINGRSVMNAGLPHDRYRVFFLGVR